MYQARGTIESVLVLFYANLGPNNGATSPKQWLGLFSWGLPGKTGDFWPRRTWAYELQYAISPIGDFAHASADHTPTCT